MTKNVRDADDDQMMFAKDVPKAMLIKVLNNSLNGLFFLALILLAYNCETCGGPRMSWW